LVLANFEQQIVLADIGDYHNLSLIL